MSYKKLLDDIRNNIHRDVVVEATVKNITNGNDSDGVLQLDTHIPVKIEVLYPYEGENFIIDAFIDSVDCNTGILLGADGDNNEVTIHYSDLTMEELVSLHESVVVHKQYKFLQYES